MSMGNPLLLDPHQALLKQIAASTISTEVPFAIAPQLAAQCRAAIVSGIAPAQWIDLVASVEAGDRWAILGQLSAVTAEWSQPMRDFVALGLVLDNMAESATDEEDLKHRAIDTALEALSTSYTTADAIEAVVAIATNLLEDSKSGVRSMLTSNGVGELFSLVHETQVYFTGIYVPYLDNAVSWGQRKLENLGDEELSLALASDLLRLQLLSEAGGVAAVRGYSTQLTNDVRALSAKRAQGASSHRAKHIALFTTVLSYVAAMLDEVPDGMATDVAPDLEGMRVSEARHLAELQSVTLKERDGNQVDDEPRDVWRAENWHVTRQWPPPGEPLPKNRRIHCWILKRGEKLSPRAASDYRSMAGSRASSTAASPQTCPPDFEGMRYSEVLKWVASEDLVVKLHDGQGLDRFEQMKASPGEWVVRRQGTPPSHSGVRHLWLLKTNESALTVEQSKAYLALVSPQEQAPVLVP